jgi:hypothetical protein
MDYRPEVEKIIVDYEKKNYFGDKEIIENQVKLWEKNGSPQNMFGIDGICTEEKIREKARNYLHNYTMNSFMKLVDLIKAKNENELIEKIRYDQPVSKKIFKAVTGINLEGFNNKEIKNAINKYVKGSV